MAVISVRQLGKQFRLGTRMHNTLRDQIAAWMRRDAKSQAESFWALKDVNFDVNEGEVLGIIGRNGAGKSTLLKVLSQITEPTEGEVRIRGRVASLLEVGTGFHPELSGRENVSLNGAILGMSRREIRSRFDEIVAFAEVEKFIDTPVKHYSSGMYVRLAFAVAAHLEPEILIVDEVLAVGDAQFQQKCMGKMEDASKKDGRTVIFVSHNMAAVGALCDRAILLDRGRVCAEGRSREIVARYLEGIHATAEMSLAERTDRKGDGKLKFTKFGMRRPNGTVVTTASCGEPLELVFDYVLAGGGPLRNVHVAVGVHSGFDENLFHLSTNVSGSDFAELPGRGRLSCRLPEVPIQPGRYTFNLFCSAGGEVADWIQNAGVIEVEAADYFPTGKLPPPEQGPLLVKHTWTASPE